MTSTPDLARQEPEIGRFRGPRTRGRSMAYREGNSQDALVENHYNDRGSIDPPRRNHDAPPKARPWIDGPGDSDRWPRCFPTTRRTTPGRTVPSDNHRNTRPVLLLGAKGQIGRAVLESLASLGEVVATARAPADVPRAGRWIALDVTDLAALRRAVREVQPAVLVNAAAYTAVDRAETEVDQATLVNAEVPGVLAEEALRLGATLVHYSTDYVFDGAGTRPWREDDPPRPLSAYGRSKLAGEEAIRASGAAHVILRASWVYAPHGHNFVNTMLSLGATRAELRVVDDQIGAPTPAALIAAATTRILESLRAAPSDQMRDLSGTLHVCCAGETSWHGFAEEIFRLARAAGLPLKVEHVAPISTTEYPTAAQRPHNSRLDCALAAERFGIRLPGWRAALVAEFPAIAARAREG